MQEQTARTRKNGLYKPRARSRITNGTDLLPGIDHRLGWVRRFRDLLSQHISDLGGIENASHAELALAKRATCLIVSCEQMEAKFAASGGARDTRELDKYGRAVNSLRRVFETLGLQRRQKDVTPDLDTYLRDKYGAEAVDG